jgi:hypothetical protein
VIKACRKHGKSAGRLVPTIDEGVAFHDRGFDFICYSGDVWALHGAVQQAVSAIREGAGQQAVSDMRAGGAQEGAGQIEAGAAPPRSKDKPRDKPKRKKK